MAATLAAFLFLAAKKANAETWFGGGVDVVHEPDTTALVLRHDWLHVIYADGIDGAVGAAWTLRDRGLEAALGVVVVQNTTERVGTHVNFMLVLGYTWKDWAVRITHISHGRSLGIAEDKPNGGLNLLTIERRF